MVDLRSSGWLAGTARERNMRRIRRFEMLGLSVIFGVLLLAFGPSPALAQASGTWVTTGSMTTLRSHGDASTTLLHNGQVLVAGGNNGSTYLASAELYNPAQPAGPVLVRSTKALSRPPQNGQGQ
jgi:hypothetical protein